MHSSEKSPEAVLVSPLPQAIQYVRKLARMINSFPTCLQWVLALLSHACICETNHPRGGHKTYNTCREILCAICSHSSILVQELTHHPRHFHVPCIVRRSCDPSFSNKVGYMEWLNRHSMIAITVQLSCSYSLHTVKSVDCGSWIT